MVVEREAVVEILVSVGAVGAFVGVIVLIGQTFNESGLSGDGALALIGAIVGFILLMAVVGIGLAFYMNRE
jgi:NADH:ubiquinone oxidoreductase subunit 6 (subunit J)